MDPMSPFLRTQMVSAVERQMQGDDPPETRRNFERLTAEGVSEEKAKRLIAAALLAHMIGALFNRNPLDWTLYVKRLARLPDLGWVNEDPDLEGREETILELAGAGVKSPKGPRESTRTKEVPFTFEEFEEVLDEVLEDDPQALKELEDALEENVDVPEATTEEIDASIRSYRPPVDALLRLGRPAIVDWLDYPSRFGFGAGHVSELIRMATDLALFQSGEVLDVAPYAPVHAWRALAQLGAAEAAGPLLDSAAALDAFGDDWYMQDFPEVFAGFGPRAVAPLIGYLQDEANPEFPRVAAANCLAAVGNAHPETRAKCIDAIAKTLSRDAEGDSEFNDPETNAFLVSALLRLKAVEAYPIIRDSYARGRVWPDILDWGSVQEELGVSDPDPTPDSLFPGRRRPAPVGPRPPKRRVKPATKNEKRRRQKKARKKKGR